MTGLHARSFASGEDPFSAGSFVYDPVSGFEWMPRTIMAIGNITQGTVYGEMMRAYDVMKAAKASARPDDKAHYELLMGKIAYSLK